MHKGLRKILEENPPKAKDIWENLGRVTVYHGQRTSEGGSKHSRQLSQHLLGSGFLVDPHLSLQNRTEGGMESRIQNLVHQGSAGTRIHPRGFKWKGFITEYETLQSYWKAKDRDSELRFQEQFSVLYCRTGPLKGLLCLW